MKNLFTFLAAIAMLISVPAWTAAQEAVDDAAAAAEELRGAAEEDASEEEEPRWITSLAFGGSLTQGNSDTLGLNLDVLSQKLTDLHEFSTGAVGSYGQTEGETSTQSGRVFFNYKRLWGDSYGFSDIELFHDKIARIRYRLTAALGYGRYVINNDRTKLGLEAGLAFIREDFEDILEGDVVNVLDADNRVAFRFAQNFEHQLSETAKIWETIEYLPEVSDFGNFLLNATAGIEAAINAKMSLRLALENRYNAEPPPGTKKNDFATVAALVFKL